jgi:hypothetical protein
MSVNISKETIKEIAEQLDMGMKCFYHIQTGELEYFPDELKGHAGYDEELWEDSINKVEENFHEYIPFEGMESDESFRIIEEFVEMIVDEKARQRFEDAIGYRKPFQNFKQLLLDYPELREQWFAYKDQCYIDFVKEQAEVYNRSQQSEENDSAAD